MAEIGRGPLSFVGNELRCGACDVVLPGRAAGYTIAALHIGPVLDAVVITDPRGKRLHSCEGAASTPPPRRRRPAERPAA